MRAPLFCSSSWVIYREVSPARYAENVPGIFPLETRSQAGILDFFLDTAPLAVRFSLNGGDKAKYAGLAAAVLRDELAPPPGGHHLGAGELDEGPLDFVLERLPPPAWAVPLPRPSGRCCAPDRLPRRRRARVRRGLHGGDLPEDLAIGQGVRRKVLLGSASGRASFAKILIRGVAPSEPTAA